MPVGDRLLGIFVAQFVEAEAAALDDFEAARDRSSWPRNSRAISAAGFRWRSALAARRKPASAIVQCFADAGQHILQRPPLGDVVEHVVGRDERQPGRLGESREAGEAAHIVAAIEVMRGEIGAAREIRRDPSGEFRDPAST